MARKIIMVEDDDLNKYGILVTDTDGTGGWIVGQEGKVLLFATEKEAGKALKKMKEDDRYSWNCTAEVAKFTGFKKPKKSEAV